MFVCTTCKRLYTPNHCKQTIELIIETNEMPSSVPNQYRNISENVQLLFPSCPIFYPARVVIIGNIVSVKIFCDTPILSQSRGSDWNTTPKVYDWCLLRFVQRTYSCWVNCKLLDSLITVHQCTVECRPRLIAISCLWEQRYAVVHGPATDITNMTSMS